MKSISKTKELLNSKQISAVELTQEYLKKATELKIYDPNIPIIRDYCLYNDKK